MLKNKLSEYVRLAAGGEVVLIFDRDRVVAELVPADRARAVTVVDAVLADLVRNGVVAPALVGPNHPLPVVARRTLPLRSVLRGLDSDRGER